MRVDEQGAGGGRAAGPAPGSTAERRQLLSLAFRMLGTIADAEDAVQEAYVRLYRLTDDERAALQEPVAWLRRVTARICLDLLGSARVRRERYVGQWLPEPLPGSAFADGGEDPLDRAAVDESVSTALLVVLESMTPAERVAFVLHDVFAMPFSEVAQAVGRTPAACRQLASAARARVRAARYRPVPRDEHDRVVRAFAAAARSGDLAALISTLDADVVLRSDGGGAVTAARRPVLGADRVARFLLGALAQDDRTAVVEQETRDGLGFAIRRGGRVDGVVTLDAHDGRVTAVRIVLNPEKLTLWRDERSS